MPSNRQSIVDRVVRLAVEQAESIKQLPRQIKASFSTGAPAEERTKSIGSACIEIQFELGPVTNYIERNEPHLYQNHLRRLLSILDRAEKCAAYDIPEYSNPSIRVKRASPGASATADLFVTATKFAESLCEWAEELEAAVRERTSEPVGAGTRGGKGKRGRLGRKPDTDSEANDADLPLREAHIECMEAMRLLKATKAEKREKAERIARKARGPSAHAGQVKELLADLTRWGLADSRTGRGGGSWLTPDGRKRLSEVKRKR